MPHLHPYNLRSIGSQPPRFELEVYFSYSEKKGVEENRIESQRYVSVV